MRMTSTSLILLGGALGAILCGQASWAGKGQGDVNPGPLSIDEARSRAELLHETLDATLHVVHRDFYREDEGLPIPAASLAKVFRALEEKQGVTLRWLAVDGEAMNVDHKARDEFEQAAAKSIHEGQSYESTQDNIYRRAAAITLTSECLKCHVPNRKSTENRSAGLIISMRLNGGK